MRIEKIIKKKCGTDNCFRVPDGFFDNFAAQVMDKLPEKKSRIIELKPRTNTRRHYFRPLLYVAASVCAVILSTVLIMKQHVENTANNTNISKTEVHQSVYEDYVDEAADYAMMDNHDIYACVSGDE